MAVRRRRLMVNFLPVEEPVTCSTKDTRKCKDFSGILFLTFLYTLQGIPLGLAAAVPYLLQSDAHTVSYRYQAIFSWVFWPFSLKLAWAPIVDSLYVSWIGRRKTWLIPVQYALGIDCFLIACRVDKWLGRAEGHQWGALGVAGDVQIWALTSAFFGLTFLAATQDIVVDGWALTVLSKENVGWASTCNTVGQTLGYILGFIVFLTLESPEVCNSYLRRTPIPGTGIISFSGFLYLCGGVFVVSTTLVALFKREAGSTRSCPSSSSLATGRRSLDESREALLANGNSEFEVFLDDNVEGANIDVGAEPGVEVIGADQEKELSLAQTYRVMLDVLRLHPILLYITFVFLVKFVFSAADSVFGLKVLEHGVSKERMALIGSAVLPLQALFPLLITHWSNGPSPLKIYLNAAVPRALMVSLTVAVIHYVDYFRTTLPPPAGSPPDLAPTYTFSTSFYILLLAKLAVYSVFSHTMFVCQMAFHARISDPGIGGTYMTLLNTASNLAGSLPSTLMLFLVDPLTVRTCDGPVATQFLAPNATCKGPPGIEACRLGGGSCRTIADGFYVEVGFCLCVGVVAYWTVLRRIVRSLDALPPSAYRCPIRTS